jgi:methionyl-tRNA synthetase
MSRFYITTAIDYVNSRPHLGTAYEKIAADVIARYKRLAGFDVHFVMGNDEHSQNVFRKAKELGEEPLAYCDRMAGEFLDVWRRLDLSFDDFIRTTEPRHRASVQELIRRATSTRGTTKAGIASPARRSSRRRTSSRVFVRSTAPSRTGFARRTTSSDCQSISSRY